MLKDLVQYTDIDGLQASKTVYFNLTQFELEAEMELEIIQTSFQKFMDEVVGDDDEPVRDMTGPEKRELLGMVKKIIQHSYGIKNGKNFDKNDAIWHDFEASGAFSAYIYQLFNKPDAVNRFMKGIWPQGVDSQTPEGSALSVVPEAQVRDDMGLTVDTPDADIPSITNIDEKLWGAYSKDEILRMTNSEFEQLVMRSKDGNNVPFPLIQLGMQRQAGGGSAE